MAATISGLKLLHGGPPQMADASVAKSKTEVHRATPSVDD